MKSSTLVLVLFLSLALGGAAQYVPVGEQRVYHTQVLLKKRGYNPVAVDGVFGKNTSKAIRRFQRDAGSACHRSDEPTDSPCA